MTNSKNKTNGKAFIKTVKALRALFNKYPDGEWLPSGRKMAERFGVSYVTYCKALNRMVKEGFARSYPKKGHYILPAYIRCRKIGLIFESGENSPFIGQCKNASAILNTLSEHSFAAQILQEVSFSQLYDSAMANGVEGLIWFDPPPKAAKHIEQIDANCELPLVVVQLQKAPSGQILGKGNVVYNESQIQQERAKLLHSFGYSCIAFVGNTYLELNDKGTVGIYQDAGIQISPDLCFKNPVENSQKFIEILEKNKVKALFSEGGGFLVGNLFAILSEMPEQTRPEVLLADFPLQSPLFHHFPSIKSVPIPGKQKDDIGEAAAKMLLDHILDGKELTHTKVGIKYNI